MAIAQEITVTAPGMSFEDWVASLTGDAKTEAEATVADRNTKFDAQVAAGNVYIDTDGIRIWISEEAEQAHIDNVGQAYADLWAQWAEETSGSLTVNVSADAEFAPPTTMPIMDWARQNLSSEDFSTFASQVLAIMDEDGYNQNNSLHTDEFKTFIGTKYPLFKSTKDSYDAYVASL